MRRRKAERAVGIEVNNKEEKSFKGCRYFHVTWTKHCERENL